ncbi:MAG TPA: methyltransferase domain-containing protein [Burkholderiaceae bacterium]|nr:methyltransferase domain-containing protein [Burkholderiaceae bacterium]
MQGGIPGDSERSRREWSDWLASAPGRYLLDWEQQCFDAAVSDVFGFHAIQLGFGQLDALRNNRMPTRILALAQAEPVMEGPPTIWPHTEPLRARPPLAEVPARPGPEPAEAVGAGSRLILERFEELPFAEQSIDLIVMPHVLEFAEDPHEVLREVNRVLRPEGRVLLSGLNPISLWGARQIMPRPFLPRRSKLIGLPRLRDWFKLLSFDYERGRYGCYRPPCRTERWLQRTEFMEKAGDRWWPICGAVYFVAAVKRVRGMRLIGPAWKRDPATRPRAVVAAPQFAPPERENVISRRGPG